jgi:hypothetical protein
MSRGTGMRTGYKMGDWYALCDRCQKKFYASQLKLEWTGWRVCESCWEPRHPQEFLKGKRDDQNVPWTRPDQETTCSPNSIPGKAVPGCAIPGFSKGYKNPL